ncbi:unnamed protein product [Meganyctiphanes norvegica]|uniref:Uncharacterized protein n=1 Tax=Meganyctiphanes norvegica TaxID=48144 RepID=A0AAV2S7Z4_MEGNR
MQAANQQITSPSRTGERYVNTKYWQKYVSPITGKTIIAKKIGKPCTCTKLCFATVGDETITFLHAGFWAFDDHDIQTAFIQKHVKEKPGSPHDTEYKTRTRKRTREYCLKVGDNLVEVCKEAFASILGISPMRVSRAMNKVIASDVLIPDMQEKHTNPPQMSTLQLAEYHIDNVPTVTNYYCRDTSHNVRYLEVGVESRAQMYLLYQEWLNTHHPGTEPIKQCVYEGLLTFEFPSLKLSKSRYDTCRACDIMNTQMKKNVKVKTEPEEVYSHEDKEEQSLNEVTVLSQDVGIDKEEVEIKDEPLYFQQVKNEPREDFFHKDKEERTVNEVTILGQDVGITKEEAEIKDDPLYFQQVKTEPEEVYSHEDKEEQTLNELTVLGQDVGIVKEKNEIKEVQLYFQQVKTEPEEVYVHEDKEEQTVNEVLQANNQQNLSPSGSLKRNINPENWQHSIAKKACNSGKQYVSPITGKTVPAKNIGNPCTCTKQCFAKVGDESITALHAMFWESDDHNFQTAFIQKHVTEKPVIHHNTGNETRTKIFRREYWFKVGDNLVEVCKEAFASILGISRSRIYRAIKTRKITREYCLKVGDNLVEVCKEAFASILGISPMHVSRYRCAHTRCAHVLKSDMQGKHMNHPKVSTLQLAQYHIDNVPTVTNHYCRNTSHNVRYLEVGVESRAHMYQLYQEWLHTHHPGMEPIKQCVYEGLLISEFPSLKLSKSRSDTCRACDIMNTQLKKNVKVKTKPEEVHSHEDKDEQTVNEVTMMGQDVGIVKEEMEIKEEQLCFQHAEITVKKLN